MSKKFNSLEIIFIIDRFWIDGSKDLLKRIEADLFCNKLELDWLKF